MTCFGTCWGKVIIINISNCGKRLCKKLFGEICFGAHHLGARRQLASGPCTPPRHYATVMKPCLDAFQIGWHKAHRHSAYACRVKSSGPLYVCLCLYSVFYLRSDFITWPLNILSLIMNIQLMFMAGLIRY